METTDIVISQANEALRNLVAMHREDFNEMYSTIHELGAELYVPDNKIHEYDLDLDNPPSISKLNNLSRLIEECDSGPILMARTVFNMWYYQVLMVAFIFQIAVKVRDRLVAKKLLLPIAVTQCPFNFNWPQEFIYCLMNHYAGWASIAVLPELIDDSNDANFREHTNLELVLLEYTNFADKLRNGKDELIKDIDIRFNICGTTFGITYYDTVNIKDLAREVKKKYLEML